LADPFTVDSSFGTATVTFYKCPLITAPAKAVIGELDKKAMLDALYNKEAFLSNVVIPNLGR
jgi:hypothetical protein